VTNLILGNNAMAVDVAGNEAERLDGAIRRFVDEVRAA